KQERLQESVARDIERMREVEHFPGIYKYAGFLYDNPASLLDYVPEHGLIILDEMARIQETATQLDEEEAEWYTSLLETERMVEGSTFSFDWETVRSEMKQQRSEERRVGKE